MRPARLAELCFFGMPSNASPEESDVNAPCHQSQAVTSPGARRRKAPAAPSANGIGGSLMRLCRPALLRPVSVFESGEELLAAVGRPLGSGCWSMQPQQAEVLAAAAASPAGDRRLPPALGARGGLLAQLMDEVVQVNALRADYRGCLRAWFSAGGEAYAGMRIRGQLLAACATADAGVQCTIRLVLESDGLPRLLCVADIVVCFYFVARPARSCPPPERPSRQDVFHWPGRFGLGGGLRPVALAV